MAMTTRMKNKLLSSLCWRPRFNLKTLLIVFSLVALVLATAGVHLQRARQQQLAVTALSAAGASVRFEGRYMHRHGIDIVGDMGATTFREHWDDWLVSTFGKDAAYKVDYVLVFKPPYSEALKEVQKLPWLRELQLHNHDTWTELSDDTWKELCRCNQIEKLSLKRAAHKGRRIAGLSKLSQLRHLTVDSGEMTVDDAKEVSKLTHLRHLDLDLVATTDEALRPISRLKSLKSFSFLHRGLSDTVTDEGVEFVSELPSLQSLKLGRLPLLTDRVFEYIEPLTQLESLNLDQASVRGTGLYRLANLPHLVRLNLIGTEIDDIALSQIAKLTQLEWLDISYSQVSDAGTHHLTSLQNLKELRIGGTDISDEALQHIAALVQLESLFLTRTKVSDEGIEKLIAMRQLRNLGLDGTKISAQGKARDYCPTT